MSKYHEKRLGQLEIKATIQTIQTEILQEKADKDTEKITGDLKRLAVTQTQVKSSQL